MKILFPISAFFIISFSSAPLNDYFFHPYTIVWNIGQGQWVTNLQAEKCQHFDLGGEFFPWRKISKLCENRQNILYLSHWDWDHIGALSKWPSWSACIALLPLGKNSPRKAHLLDKFKKCESEISQKENKITVWSPTEATKDTNSASHVLLYKHFLIPGDSPTHQESKWQDQKIFQTTKVLILGHHGSKTSTSENLLQRLPQLKMAIASARWQRYHHPSPETIALLNKMKTPLIKTEDWGNIWFEE